MSSVYFITHFDWQVMAASDLDKRPLVLLSSIPFHLLFTGQTTDARNLTTDYLLSRLLILTRLLIRMVFIARSRSGKRCDLLALLY